MNDTEKFFTDFTSSVTVDVIKEAIGRYVFTAGHPLGQNGSNGGPEGRILRAMIMERLAGAKMPFRFKTMVARLTAHYITEAESVCHGACGGFSFTR